MATSKHKGGCHCGKVRYEVAVDTAAVMECNCSLCSKKGGVLGFAPASDFALLSGEDALTDYQFNKMVIHHLFCSTCGVQSFSRGMTPDGRATVAVNIRCLDGIDTFELKPERVDGKSF